MEYCPVCKAELTSDSDVCAICNNVIESDAESEWEMIGSIHDSISSDYARETLKSYDIPVVIISKSGMFGAAGLQLVSFHGNEAGLFDVSVPKEFVGEATDILNMILGDSWSSKE